MTVLAPDLADWFTVLNRPATMAPALFLDRDGTVIENCDYLAEPDRVTLIAGAVDTIRAFRSAGHAVVIVTNQSGVARGLVTPEQYGAVNARMLECLGAGLVDAVIACPFHPDGQVPYRAAHHWRKPQPGMLVDAARLLDLDLGRSTLVGDSLSDIAAGAAAGVGRLVHVATGHGTNERHAIVTYAAQARAGDRPPVIEMTASIAAVRPGDCDA